MCGPQLHGGTPAYRQAAGRACPAPTVFPYCTIHPAQKQSSRSMPSLPSSNCVRENWFNIDRSSLARKRVLWAKPRAGHARPLQCFPIVPYIPHKSKTAGPCPPCRAVIACVKTGLTCIVPLSPVNDFYGQSRGPGMPGPYFSISPLCRCDYKCQPCKV